MTKAAFYTISFFISFFPIAASAQQPAYTYYTIRDGLPANDIYNCIEDKKGFLWIATENGLAKFDGKNFKTYTTARGLPDNEILVVEIDSAGTIWALPFQRNPAYYDERADRFISSDKDPELKKISLTAVNKANALRTGGIAFYNSKGGIFIYRNNRCDVFAIPAKNNAVYAANRIIGVENNNFISVSSDSLRFWKNGKLTGAQVLKKETYFNAFVNGCLYLGDSARLLKIPIHADGSTGAVTENVLPFKIASLNFTGNRIAITSVNGNIYLADTASLVFSQRAFSFNALIRYIYEDRAGNTWICTKENGLIRYRPKGIITISEPSFQRNFNTLAFYDGELVAGTNDGRLFFYKDPYTFRELLLPAEKSYTNWIRRILPFRDKLYVASEGALYISKKKSAATDRIFQPGIATKDLFFVNDSLMLAGSSSALTMLDPATGRILDARPIRVTCLNAASADAIYIGSNNGLYKTGIKRDVVFLGASNALLISRVTALAYNKPDNLLWIGLAGDTVLATQNDRTIAKIPLDTRLPGNICRTLYSTRKGILWIGTNKALARIKYRFENGKFSYTTEIFTTADGIAGRQINDITERDDTLYVATTQGISIIPSNLAYGAPEIPVYVTAVNINNRDTLLQPAYDLAWNLNNIFISYTATDLAAGAERFYQYRINNGSWITTQSESIALQQLSSGNYQIEIRALKRNGLPSENVAKLDLHIRTPFWKSSLFYAIIFISLLLALTAFIQKRSRRKRERAIEELLTQKKLAELELKALKAQINPHFVFNCLNSIKYLNHRKQFAETEKYLDNFSYLLRKTLDFSGLQQISLFEELEYSRNYLELEKLRLGEKLLFDITAAPGISVNNILVPPMLLQPYLENAVKHGIRYLRNGAGQISVDVFYEGNSLICRITDNGIGIKKSVALNGRIRAGHLSHGNTLQERRATLYGIGVAFSENPEGTGTVVTLSIFNQSKM